MDEKAPFAIEVKNLTKVFEHQGKEVKAIDGVSFTVQKGDIYGIIGPSGSGKSTLIRCILKLIKPTSGEIFCEGSDISGFKGKELQSYYKSLGMVFQHFNLMSGRTVEENISYPLEVAGWKKGDRKKRVDELLGFVKLVEKKGSYPAKLSGGEKQRVAIARALAYKTQILICDEPTSALDPNSEKEILDLLKSARDELGVTVLIVSHHMGVIKTICNKMAVFDFGKIIEEGEIIDLFLNPKHPITKRFAATTFHEIPSEFFKPPSPNRRVVWLRGRNGAVKRPLLSQIIKQFDLEANIFFSWIDKIQGSLVGGMIVELCGSEEGINRGIQILLENQIQCEVIESAK